ncbi:MAG TPA: LysM domain-containing protein [Acetobacteraceae bacterium]|jgi:murein DD-endopeptidase MepM/ murein hydrolase activator NlpD
MGIMLYQVSQGETLTSIAKRCLGSEDRWDVIAKANHLSVVMQLTPGQVLVIPEPARRSVQASPYYPSTIAPPSTRGEKRPASRVPARAHVFMLADEVNPLTRKVVRRVALPVEDLDAELMQQILNPEKYGFLPRDPRSTVSVGRHVLGRTDSQFISASERLLGSPRFQGRRFWIDASKLEKSGIKIVEADQIAEDLQRIGAKSRRNTELLERIERIGRLSKDVDREVLIAGKVPPAAVKGAASMASTRALQFVEGVGIVLTVYDLGVATRESVDIGSWKPLAVETTHQVGGWAGAWAGMQVFGSIGLALGIETGPGALAFGAVGAFVGGFVGFFGADFASSLLVPPEDDDD